VDDKRKHLEFLQAAVARLANNSFAYKGWAVTVVVAALALIGQGRGPDKAGPDAILAGLVPALAFWALDARCVRRERMFRCLYDDVRVSNTTDYSMDASRFGDSVGTVWRIACTGERVFTAIRARVRANGS
jgi:hypothetical protein